MREQDLARCLRCAVLLIAWPLLSDHAAADVESNGPHWAGVVRESGHAKADLQLIRDTADLLSLESPTFRQMLTMLGEARRVIVLVRSTAIPGKLGRSQAYIATGRTFVVMEIDVLRLNPERRVRAIAHEMAHAVEIACMPRAQDTPELLRALFARPKRRSFLLADAAESEFPSAVENVVAGEHRKREMSTGEMPKLLRAHGLGACSVRDTAPVLR